MRALLGRRENPNSPAWPRATCHRERDKIRAEIGRPCAPRRPFSDGRLAGPAAFLPRPLAGRRLRRRVSLGGAAEPVPAPCGVPVRAVRVERAVGRDGHVLAELRPVVLPDAVERALDHPLEQRRRAADLFVQDPCGRGPVGVGVDRDDPHHAASARGVAVLARAAPVVRPGAMRLLVDCLAWDPASYAVAAPGAPRTA